MVMSPYVSYGYILKILRVSYIFCGYTATPETIGASGTKALVIKPSHHCTTIFDIVLNKFDKWSRIWSRELKGDFYNDTVILPYKIHGCGCHMAQHSAGTIVHSVCRPDHLYIVCILLLVPCSIPHITCKNTIHGLIIKTNLSNKQNCKTR